MPIIKSAKKQMQQNRKRRVRNYPIRSELKTVYKKALDLVAEGKIEEAKKFLPFAYKIIDMAVKKNIVHDKTAARRKSRIALALNEAEGKGAKSSGEKAPKEAPKDEREESVEKEEVKE